MYKFNAFFFFLKGIHSARSYNLRSIIEWQPAQSAKIEGLYHLGDLMVQFIANTGGPSLMLATRQPWAENSYRKCQSLEQKKILFWSHPHKHYIPCKAGKD